MGWWSTRKELIYTRVHAVSVYTLFGITVLGGIVLAHSTYSVLRANKEKKEQYIEGELPQKQ